MKNVNEILSNAHMTFEDDEKMLQEIKKKCFRSQQAIAHLRKRGFTDEMIENNILKVYDFVKDYEYCLNCPGVENCQKENALLIHEIKLEYGIVSQELRPCRKILEKAQLENQFVVSDFNHAWMTKTIKSLDSSKGRIEALKKFENYKNDTSDKWIYLTGKMNSGRTYISAIMCIELAKINRGPVCFLNTPNRLSNLSSLSFKDKDKFEKTLDIYVNVPVLVLDDFGTELKNDLVRNIILQIFTKRSGKHLFTIINSDYSINDIVELYSQTKSASIEAKRIGDILKQECQKEINLGGLEVY